MYKVLIRPLEISDAEISWKWRNNPVIWQLTGSKPSTEITLEIEREWIENAINDKSSRRFAILVDEVYVGNIQLTNIQESQSAEYHIFIGDTNYWNKGIARLASLQIIRYSKNSLGLKKLTLFVNPKHKNAIKLYLSCNFIVVSDEIKMELDLQNSPKPAVSIFVMVYNHEKFITDAIEGFLSQKCNFDFDIIVGEDCSKDKSREILIQYQKKFPGKFKLLLHDTNIGASKNQIEVLNNCKADYIAMCEGDDYWTDSLKLQKQVDFLEANPDYVLCFHQINILKKDGSIVEDFITKVPENYEKIETLARLGNYIHTPSVVFRNILSALPFEFEISPIGDYFLYMMLAEHGKLKFIDEKMAIYRHDVGILSGKNEVLKLKIWIDCLILMFSNCKDEKIKRILYERYETCLQQMYKLTLKVENKRNFGIKGILKKLKNRM